MLDDASQAWLDATLRGDQAEADRLEAVLGAATLLEQQARDRPDRIRTEALAYAAAGVPVIPLHGIRDGRCGCGRACASPAKHPLTANGLHDASIDPAVVDGWWAKWPGANVGIRTGIGFDVIDVDGHEGMVAMYGRNNALIDDFTVLGIATSGRDGGRHVYIPVTGRRNGTALVPGVDFRGQGGYVVAPPSISVTGRRYEWIQPLDLAATEAAA